MKKINEKQEFNFWRYLINFWSILFLILIFYDFIYGPLSNSILSTVSTIYISILAIYVGNKEFERWYDKHEGKHPGEIFVFLWTFIIFLLIVSSFLFKKSYNLPDPVVSSYIAVLTILVITNKSKQMYKTKHNKKTLK